LISSGRRRVTATRMYHGVARSDRDCRSTASLTVSDYERSIAPLRPLQTLAAHAAVTSARLFGLRGDNVIR